MARQMSWDNDQQAYVGEINDQSTGYLLRIEVDGDEFSEELAGLGPETEAMLLNPMAWLDCEGNDRVQITRVRELTPEEMRTPRDWLQPSDPNYASPGAGKY